MRTTKLLTAALIGAALVLSGCGGSSDAQPEGASQSGPYAGKTPKDVYDTTRKQAAEAASVRIKGDLVEGSDKVVMDLRIARAGNVSGSLSMGSQGSLKLLVVDGTGFMLPGKDMLKTLSGGDAEVLKYLDGKWMELGQDADSQGIMDLADMDELSKMVLEPTGGEVTFVTGKEFDGRKTVGLEEQGSDSIIYVAADGSAELVAIQAPDGDITWSDWNEPVRVKAPKKVITADELS